jgi:hypothetical protein
MKKINAAQVKPVSSLKGNEKGIAWFCIEEIIEKKTKNGKTFYRLRVCDDNSSSKWVRVWSKFNQIPELYTIWLAEISSNETWGYSTSTYKMKKIDV